MPRKGRGVRRDIGPDLVYQNVLVTQLINKVLLDGKKTLAELFDGRRVVSGIEEKAPEIRADRRRD